jgi:HTH-type transcriptional regulator/antitoxin MqsA
MDKETSCYLCDSPAYLVRGRSKTMMGARPVTFEDEFYKCSNCGEKFYVGAMADERSRRAAAAVRRVERLLAPDEIREIRTRYGMSQADFERLINSGEKTVVRWEKGTVAQNATADTLLRILRDHPDVVAKLAEERKVKLALPKPAEAAQAAA